MKKILRIILIMILVFSSLKAKANIINDSELKSIIAKQVEQNYKKYTDAQLNVQVVALPFKDLELPNGKVSFVVKPTMDKFLARDLEKVSVYVNGKFINTFNAPVVITVWDDVLVASRFINRENQINSQDVVVKKMEISNIIQYPLRADALGKDMLAKKAFRTGEIIDQRFVKLRPDVLRNANVTVFFKTNDLTISIEATALSDGIVGDNICLMSKSYNKVYRGKVIGENKVLVAI